MSAYDFSSPFYTAALINTSEGPPPSAGPPSTPAPGIPGRASPVEKRTPLWFKPDLEEPIPFDIGPEIRSVPWVTAIEVEIVPSRVPIIRVTIEPPFLEGIAFLDSDLIRWGDTKIEVTFGYSTGESSYTVSPTFRGVITKPSFDIGESMTISLEAQGVSMAMNRVEVTRDWSNYTRLDMIKEILTNYSSFRLDESTIPTQEVAPKLYDKVSLQQAFRDDWYFMNEVAWQAGCWLIRRGDTYRIVSIDDAYRGNPNRSFVFYRHSQGRTGFDASGNASYPISSVSSPTPALWLPTVRAQQVIAGLDTDEREAAFALNTDEQGGGGLSGDIPSTGEEPDTRLGEGSASPPENTEGDRQTDAANGAVNAFSGNPTDPIIQDLAKSEYKRLSASNLMGVQLDFETPGIPDLEPGEIISVQGLGARVGGNYAVYKVVHRYDSSGFITTTTAISNTLKVMDGVGPVAANTTPPTSTAEFPDTASGGAAEGTDVAPVTEPPATPSPGIPRI